MLPNPGCLQAEKAELQQDLDDLKQEKTGLKVSCCLLCLWSPLCIAKSNRCYIIKQYKSLLEVSHITSYPDS